MKTSTIFSSAVRADVGYAPILDSLKKPTHGHGGSSYPTVASGLSEGAADALCLALAEDLADEHRPLLFLCESERDCHRMAALMRAGGATVAVYPTRDIPFHNMTQSREFEHERIEVLTGIRGGLFDAVLTTPDAALSFTLPEKNLSDALIDLDISSEYDLRTLAVRLTAAGYVRADMAEGPGQFSLRGGILDICAPCLYYEDGDGKSGGGRGALRLEFFDREIDRMGLYDIMTQRMLTPVTHARIAPARETLISTAETVADIAREIKKLRKKASPTAASELDTELTIAMAYEGGGTELGFADKYISLIYPEHACLLDYLPERSVTVVRGNAEVNDRLKAALWRMTEEAKDAIEAGIIPAKYAEYSHDDAYMRAYYGKRRTLLIDSMLRGMADMKLDLLEGFRTRHAVAVAGNNTLLLEELNNYMRTRYRVVLMATNETEAKNYSGLISEWGIDAHYAGDGTSLSVGDMEEASVAVISSCPIRPFELLTPRVALMSLAAESRAGAGDNGKQKKHRDRKNGTETILSYADLREGDYVVHDTHGIGIYEGISTMSVGGNTHDYITIRYQGSDKLFLPVEKLDRVSKYIGAREGDGSLKLSRFGGSEWGKTKAKTRSALKNIAKELITLYAERMRREGYAFSPDDDFQRDFESAFEYNETGAQLDAIADIKADMMLPRPMDRLLCGDVGYGKTEVAFRAAYKAMLSGKQVALLVPTTILALQHYQTAMSRMRSFPVSVGMLSRFTPPKEQRRIISGLERGDIDLVIGTHKLLSDKIKFRDLGLLIVDEEQRFGVAQKERIKRRSGNIDVLSLSATPIPRTLNMSMTGIRDISVLDEAPEDRLPVQTYVLEYDSLIINDAIRRELRRGGQVFYLYNRVETIYEVAARLSDAIPEARITVAHGKMERDELEHIWADMLGGEIDVLLSTTIIETGVDVPNANTLIVENSHRLGLSQLHQLRGRVGRSSRRAYAYFTFPRDRSLPEVAVKRLEAIREYTEFGAGFKIALRDLEIRGAGNILGAEQHGHLDAVGYDMYIKLLNEAVLEERGERPEERVEATVSLECNAYLPADYIESASQRMQLYKQIAHIRSKRDLYDLADELSDRYGELPRAAESLLYVSLLRAKAEETGASAVVQNGAEVRITLDRFEPEIWDKLIRECGMRLTLLSGEKDVILMRLPPSAQSGIEAVKAIFEVFETFLKIKETP